VPGGPAARSRVTPLVWVRLRDLADQCLNAASVTFVTLPWVDEEVSRKARQWWAVTSPVEDAEDDEAVGGLESLGDAREPSQRGHGRPDQRV
jgi:hypothetical protein